MTVTPLPAPRALAWVERMRSDLSSPFDPADLSARQLRELSRDLSQVRAMLDARQVVIARELDRADTAKTAGFTSTGALLAGDFGGNRAAGDRLVQTARNLQTATRTDAALAAGELSLEQAETISRAVADLPDKLNQAERDRVETRLIGNAKTFTLADLRRRVMRIADLYADKAEADRDENTKLALQEAKAWQNTELWIGQPRDGLVPGGFTIPQAQADMLKACLDAVAAPRRRHLGLDTPPDGGYSTGADLSAAQRLGRAFCAWIEHLPTDGYPTTGGTPALVTVNLDYDQLCTDVEEAAPGTLSTGTRLSAGQTRRLACQIGIIPKILGTPSVLLDQGRSARLFTPAQRIALAERDHGCTYPGCDRPPGWCEAHHLDHWAKDNGPTTVNNGTLLCAWHHHHVHRENTHIRNHDGRIEFQLNGIWHRNQRWRP